MKYLLILSVLTVTSAYAGKAKVLIVDPDVDSSSLEKDYEVQRPAQHYSLPDKQTRDEVLSGVKSVQSYDELKKDILFMDLSSKSLKDLKAKYPEITESEFKQMQARK